MCQNTKPELGLIKTQFDLNTFPDLYSDKNSSCAFSVYEKGVKINGRRFLLRDGMAFIQLQLTSEKKICYQMDWSSELVVFAHLKGENLGLSLPDLGSQQLSENQWSVLSGTTARAYLNSGSDCSLKIWILSKKLLSKILNDLDLASCALDCFACPAVSLPAFIKGDADHSLSMKVDLLSHIVDKKGSYSPLAVEARVLEGLQSFLEQPTLSRIQNCQEACFSDADRNALLKAAEYMASNLGDNHTLALIAREVGINEFKLKKGFKSLFGKTVFNWLRDKRMEQAAIDFRYTDRKVIEVANEVGYSNPSHFARNFKTVHGVLPRCFRNVHRKDSYPSPGRV